MSKKMSAAFAVLTEYSKQLTCTDFKPYQWVEVWHDDGTHYQFRHAFAHTFIQEGEEFLFVFTEHNGYHIFHTGDLREDFGWNQYEAKPIKTTPLEWVNE